MEIGKKAKKSPKIIVEAIKETGKEIVASADKGSTRQIFIGALLSPLLNQLYGIAYDFTLGRIPMGSQLINKIVRILVPIPIAYAVKKAKVPVGNLINGTLYGISVAQLINLIIDFIMGNAQAPPDTTIDAEDLSISPRTTNSMDIGEQKPSTSYIPANWA